ncbi:MAG: hypothetical protein HUU46_12240 [Candidatus Hydrogenedentes bacterium]|nr:hypothetical protein [Candidatus Hydrogenedentota bacterium]
MPAYEFNGHIAEDHTIELPLNIPTGWAEIVVITDSNCGKRATLKAVLFQLDQRTPRNQSKDAN